MWVASIRHGPPGRPPRMLMTNKMPRFLARAAMIQPLEPEHVPELTMASPPPAGC